MIVAAVRRLACTSTIVLMACADTAILEPRGPVALPPQGARTSTAGDGTVPYYEREEDVPGPFWQPRIDDKIVGVSWTGSTTSAESWLWYYGNRGQGNFRLMVSGIDNLERSVTSKEEEFWPGSKMHKTDPFSVYGRSQCGNRAELRTEHIAAIVFDVGPYRHVKTVMQPGQAEASQPPCGESIEDYPASQPPSGGTGGGPETCATCVDEPATGPTWCRYRRWYVLDTNETVRWEWLYCW